MPLKDVEVRREGVSAGLAEAINFIEGTNVTITTAADTANDEIDVTIAASGGGASFGPPTGQIDIGDANDEGAGANSTRTDHQHSFPAPAASYPLDVAAAEADGTATTPARSDHVHAHGSAYAGGHTDVAAHSGSVHTDPGTPAQIDIGDAAAAGTGTNPPAADDHQHAFPAPTTGYPLDVDDSAEADGTGATVARSDHKHALRLAVKDEGVVQGAGVNIIDFIGSGVSVSVTGTEADVTVTGGGGGYNTIQDDGVAETQRAILNFQDGFEVVDDAVDSTDVDLSYGPAGYPLDATFAAEADGTAITVARSDHRHTITDPTTLPATIDLDSETSTEGTSTDVARADHGHGIATDDNKFTVGCLLDGAGAAPAVGFRMLWRAPFACTVTNIRGHVDAGTTTQINARRNQTSDFLAVDYTITAANAWQDAGAVQNTAIAAGDDIEAELVAAGTATKVNIQIDLTRP